MGIINTLQEQKLVELCDGLKNRNGGRLTLVTMNGAGFPAVLQITLGAARIVKYAQYNNALELIFKKRGGRTLNRIIYHDGSSFALFEGWRTPAENLPNSFWSFDKNLFYKIVDSVTDGEKIGELSERIYIDVAAGMERIYYVVSTDGATYYDGIEDLKRHFEIVGEVRDSIRRAELQGAPKIKGLAGPMYDGERDGKACIRYETREAYALYSN